MLKNLFLMIVSYGIVEYLCPILTSESLCILESSANDQCFHAIKCFHPQKLLCPTLAMAAQASPRETQAIR